MSIWRCPTHGPLLPLEVTLTETCGKCQEPITFGLRKSTRSTAKHITKRLLAYDAYELKLAING